LPDVPTKQQTAFQAAQCSPERRKGREVTERDFTETRLCIATNNYLRGIVKGGRNPIRAQVPFPGLVCTHVANERENAAETVRAHLMGVMPGVYDWLFWWPGRNHGIIELKVKSSLSSNQKNFLAHWQECGFTHHGVAYKVSEVRDTLKSWGLQCRNEACIEAAPSKAAQQKMWEEMQSP